MSLPTSRNIGIVYRKEMIDLLRDKRTLFGMILLPLLLYPLLLVGLTQILAQQIGQIERQEFIVAIAGWEDFPELADAFRNGKSRWRVERAGRSEAESLRPKLAAGEIHAIVEVPAGAGRDVDAGGHVALRVAYNGADEDSLAAWRRLQPVLERLRRDLVERRLRAAALDPSVLDPLRVEEKDQATPTQRGAFHLGRLLCVMLVVMAATGAFYPAVDMASGEKERGTMQTLLVSPASRSEIVLGKYFAVLTVCLVTALLNLASMGLTFSSLFQGGGIVPVGALDFAPGPAAILALVAVLVPLAGLFCAACLGLSAYASTYKEAMLFLSPFLLVAVLGAMAPVIPGLQPTHGLAFLPVANAALVLYRVVQGTATGWEVALNIAVNGAYALLALRWAAWIFEREDVLLRGAVEIDWRFWRRAPWAALRPFPSAAEGLTYAFVAIAGMVFAGGYLQGESTLVLLLVTQVGAFLLPLLLMLRVGGIDARRSLGLRPPGWGNVAIAMLTAVALLILSHAAIEALTPAPLRETLEKALEPLKEAVNPARPVVAVAACLLMAGLAPLCEELAFRGFLLSAFRPVVGTAVAVAGPALLFGLLHHGLSRSCVLAGVGIAFGVMAVRTGSVWTAVAAHATNNGVTVLLVMLAGGTFDGRQEGAAATGLKTLGANLEHLVERMRAGSPLAWATVLLAVATAALGLALLRPADARTTPGSGGAGR